MPNNKIIFRCPPELKGIIPKPFPAANGLPDWLKKMPTTASLPIGGGEIKTLKQCPPFIDAMRLGFIVPLATDVVFRDGRVSWNWDLPPSSLGEYTRSPVSVHHSEQVTGSPLADGDNFVVKFNNFWTITLEPGFSLFCCHPVNREDLPFQTISGLVDADRFGDGMIQFPARLIDSKFEGRLPKGTPIAQCIPVQRNPNDLSFEVLEGDTAAQFTGLSNKLASEEKVYRKYYRAKDH